MRSSRFSQIAISLVVAMGVSIGSIVYLSATGQRMAATRSPQIDAAMEIKLNATLGHLWIEEIISGDRNENIEDVWAYLEQADWYARAMLHGGVNAEGRFVALESPQIREQVVSVRDTLAEFRRIARLRYANHATSGPGSSIDQEFDRVFASFIDEADRAETLLQTAVMRDLARFRSTAFGLIAFSVLMSVVIGVVLYRLERQRSGHLAQIDDAHQEIRAKNAELEYLAHFDGLTKLPNRVLFIDRLEQAIAHAATRSECVVLMFIDLDGFKAVNDRLGHARGDRLLAITARRLGQSLRAGDSLARLGGDEFTLMLADLNDRDEAVTAARSVAHSVVEQFAKPFDLGDASAVVTASVGIGVYPFDGESGDQLLINADHAMYEAKKTKNGFCFHSREINDRVNRLLKLEHELRIGIERGELVVHYQPQWDLLQGSISGFEALVRWEHPDEGTLLPASFIPIAESSGLIKHIDSIVMEVACRQYQQWRGEGLNPGKLSVNISAILFGSPACVRVVANNVAEFCMRGEELELELTESAMLQDVKHTRELVEKLRNIGIALSIDDFGTGYSSMAYLRQFPAKTLKIDRMFVQDIHRDRTSLAIVRSMVELARNLQMQVVAEGIETAQEQAALQSLGCRYGQGYLLGTPMRADQARSLMLAQREENVSVLPQRPD